MVWFYVDDSLAVHPKPRQAGLEAMGLWAVCGSLCGDTISDGLVPSWYVESWPKGKTLARRLIEAGLWHQSGHACPQCPPLEEGYLFHDWGQANPTKAEVEARREARARAGSKGGRISGQVRAVASGKASAEASASPDDEASASAGASSSGTKQEPSTYSSVPVPVPVPVPTQMTTSSSSRPRKRGRGDAEERATRTPDAFTIDGELADWAVGKNLRFDLAAETERFLDHHRSKGSSFIDWRAAWRNWMSRAIDMRPRLAVVEDQPEWLQG